MCIASIPLNYGWVCPAAQRLNTSNFLKIFGVQSNPFKGNQSHMCLIHLYIAYQNGVCLFV